MPKTARNTSKIRGARGLTVDELLAFHALHFGDARMKDDDGDAGDSGGDDDKTDDDPPAKGDDDGKGGDDKLGDAGKRALDAERAQRKAAEKRARDAEKRAQDLEDANKSEQEKAVDAARNEGKAEATREANTKVARAEFRAAAKGRMTSEQLDALLEDLDLTKFLDENGEVDVKRIETKVDLIAPEGAGDKKTPPFNGGARKTKTTERPSLGGAIATAMSKS